MPRKSSSGASTPKRKKTKKGNNAEIQQQKSPAQFFAEHQAIAGFDNKGKSLYTSIRELVENSLDACESIGQLPSISVNIQEITTDEFNRKQGIEFAARYEEEANSKKPKQISADHVPAVADTDAIAHVVGINNGDIDDDMNQNNEELALDSALPPSLQQRETAIDGDKDAIASEPSADPPPETPKSKGAAAAGKTTKSSAKGSTPSKKQASKRSQSSYFIIQVRDNGCGMDHDAIPDLLGRVLSGSKYGVRQTRGKFGLGAKMALIWSQKSTNMPIRVVTAHRAKSRKHMLADDETIPKYKSTCVLDIDISKNCPRLHKHVKEKNDEERWIGTELELCIEGNWTTYKARIVKYFQQLAIITPYAQLEFQYSHSQSDHLNFQIRYDRRSEQMPEPARQVKHHPTSVNNLVIQQLMERVDAKMTLHKFLTSELSSISPAIATRMIKDCSWVNTKTISSLSDLDITKLVQVLRRTNVKAPDGNCLSPLGEYNLNLGIRKVLNPDYVATSRDKPGAYDGHSFLVEAAVSLGGSGNTSSNTGAHTNATAIVKEGITVLRFANRIPLLFEGAADVSTRVAMTKLKWANYKIDPKRDKIGVFVSIVSTKIPYKGTGKEYIGDDITEISTSVKRVLQMCCQQLRTVLIKRNALRDQRDRKSKLTKYIPDVSRALFGLLAEMRQRRIDDGNDGRDKRSPARGRRGRSKDDGDDDASPSKRRRTSSVSQAFYQSTMEELEAGDLDEKILSKKLHEAVVASTTMGDGEGGVGDGGSNGRQNGSHGSNDKDVDRIPLYLKQFPLHEYLAQDIEIVREGESMRKTPAVITETEPQASQKGKKSKDDDGDSDYDDGMAVDVDANADADRREANQDRDDHGDDSMTVGAVNGKMRVVDHPFFVFRPMLQ